MKVTIDTDEVAQALHQYQPTISNLHFQIADALGLHGQNRSDFYNVVENGKPEPTIAELAEQIQDLTRYSPDLVVGRRDKIWALAERIKQKEAQK